MTNPLSNYLVEQILLGEAVGVNKVVVVYAGRFQPFHKGHFTTYTHLVKKFGKDNVFIGTSNKTDSQKSPFNFKEKKEIMTTMFGIPSNKIVEVKNPYKPTEILSKFDEEKTAFVTVVGEKDEARLGGNYFKKWNDSSELDGYRDRGYVYVSPAQPNAISGTDVRNNLGKNVDDTTKLDFFTKRAYPKFNKKIYDLITNKLSESYEPIHIKKEVIEEWVITKFKKILKEVSSTPSSPNSDVDDGPNFFFPNYDTFNTISHKRAEHIGYSVFKQIMDKKYEDYYEHPIYPNGPVKAVTPFPAGVIGKTTATNQKDITNSTAYDLWFKHVTRAMALAGYSLVRDKDEIEKKLATRDLPSYRKMIKAEDPIITAEGGVNEGLGLAMGYPSKEQLKQKMDKLKKLRNHLDSHKNEYGFMHGMHKKPAAQVGGLGDSEYSEYVDEETLNENVIANILIKLIVSAGVAVIRVFLNVFVDMVVDGAIRTYHDIKDIVAPEPYIKFLKGLGKNDTFNKQFIQFAIQNKKGKNLIGNSWIEKVTTLPAFVDAFDKFTKDEGIDGSNKTRLLAVVKKTMWDTYLRNWKGIYQMLKKKYPQLANELPEGKINEIPMADLVKIDQYADKQLNPIDVVLTDKHFFERLTDPRNQKDISQAELIGFFKRLGKNKKKFVEFLNQYGEIVAKDNRTKINIPFMKQANKAIAKTIMRKDNFKTPSPELKFESLNEGMYDPKNIKAYYEALCKSEGIKPLPVKFERVNKGGAATTYNSKTMKPLYISFDVNRMSDPEFAIIHELTHQIKLETEGDAYLGKRDQLPKFKKLENHLIDKYVYSKYSKLLYETNTKFIFEAQAVSGGKVHKFITGKNLTLKGKKYSDIEFEVLSIDNRSQLVKLKVLAPKSVFGQELNVPFKTIRRGPFIKTDTNITEGLITDIQNSIKPIDNRTLLLCGGAYGHMSHPFDANINLTFGQLKDIVNRALDGELELTREKCISGDAIIHTEKNGDITIAEFVDTGVVDKVLSFNEETGKNEYMDVMASFNNDTSDEWLEIELEDGKTIQVTPNHRMYVECIGYVEAKDLTEDMELKIV